MMITRRMTVAAILLGAMVAGASAQAPAPYEATPELVEAAKKEAKVVWYTSTDVQVSEKAASAFEAKYPGIKVQVERSGSERVFQRISQEYGSKIYNALASYDQPYTRRAASRQRNARDLFGSPDGPVIRLSHVEDMLRSTTCRTTAKLLATRARRSKRIGNESLTDRSDASLTPWPNCSIFQTNRWGIV